MLRVIFSDFHGYFYKPVFYFHHISHSYMPKRKNGNAAFSIYIFYILYISPLCEFSIFYRSRTYFFLEYRTKILACLKPAIKRYFLYIHNSIG